MSEIDVQNAKQIRDPMDVLITMSLANADISMTYSGYSMAKVADGELDETSWPMRKLADLQGDGFPLDGSCVLYNASTTPSQANGKLGVRSNVGETVTVTATGNDTMASIGTSVIGAESVTINGTTTPITGTNVVIPLLASSATMVFNPASETRRIEINTVLPEADFKITNENLIRATVSLRSDLSIIDPTLPESEINIEAYFDEDVSEAVAAIPEDTPLKYQAGYPGDMSPERKFYVTGQATWADNVLTIQGVDAVHFLEDEVINDLFVGDYIYDYYLGPVFQSNTFFPSALIYYLLRNAGVEFINEGQRYISGEFHREFDNALVMKQRSLRDIIVWVMNNFHITFTGYTLPDGSHDYWPTYVDAGRPSLTITKPNAQRTIKEDDCGDVRRNAERSIKAIKLSNPHLYLSEKGESSHYNTICGNYTWIKNSGVFPQFDDYCIYVRLPYFSEDGRSNEPLTPTYQYTGDELDAQIFMTTSIAVGYQAPPARYFPTNQWANNALGWSNHMFYTQVMPWSQNQGRIWTALVTDANATTQNGDIIGIKGLEELIESEYTSTAASDGQTIVIENQGIFGRTCNGVGTEMYPALSMKSLLSRSNITGSFTWKGDPRMQPRDVVEWERLDGTTTTITLENITLTHEGGGTMAEITYREGVV